MKKTISITDNEKDIFYHYLCILHLTHKLTDMETKLLSQLIYYNWKEIPNFVRGEDRWKKVFDYDTKMLIKEHLNIQDHTLQNMLSSLRRKKVIKDNVVDSKYLIYPKDNFFEINFKFHVKSL